jgi:uroporphyrinogen-III synthase
MSDLGGVDWLVVTSPNGARRTLAELRDARDLAGVQLAAVGPGTARVFAEHHLRVDLVPERFVAEGLLAAFPDPPPGGGRVLLARAEVARDVLPDGLHARGWQVEVVDAYRTVPVEVDEAERVRAGSADAITFTSASSVTNFVVAAGLEAVPPVVVAIGPVTSAAARELGVEVTVEASEHTLDGLVAALVAALPPRPPNV